MVGEAWVISHFPVPAPRSNQTHATGLNERGAAAKRGCKGVQPGSTKRKEKTRMSELNRIAGYEAEKRELQTLIEIFNNREKYREKGASLPKGIIFYGKSGTGKTLFAQVLAAECTLKVIKVDLPTAGEQDVCRLIRKAFIKGARSRKPTMIFLDELDKLLPNQREEYCTDQSKAVLTQLLTLIDGMHTVDDIVFVATCNDYDDLPESLTRAGRFDKKIALGLPSFSSRTAILRLYANASSCQFALAAENIAKLCTGFSCAALKTLINECVLRSDEHNFISEELIREKVAEITDEDLVCKKSDASKSVQAARNIGSFLVSREYSKSDYLLSLNENTVCNVFLDSVITGINDEYDDYDDDEYDDYDVDDDDKKDEKTNDLPISKNDYLAAITALLGGYASEELLFHKTYNTLDHSMRSIKYIFCEMEECGMLGWRMTFKCDHSDCSSDLMEREEALFEQIVTECYEAAKATVTKNERLIKELIPVLIRRESIEKEECEQILAGLGGVD